MCAHRGRSDRRDADDLPAECGAVSDLESDAVAQPQLAQAEAESIAERAVHAYDAGALPQDKFGQFHTWTLFVR